MLVTCVYLCEMYIPTYISKFSLALLFIDNILHSALKIIFVCKIFYCVSLLTNRFADRFRCLQTYLFIPFLNNK